MVYRNLRRVCSIASASSSFTKMMRKRSTEALVLDAPNGAETTLRLAAAPVVGIIIIRIILPMENG